MSHDRNPGNLVHQNQLWVERVLKEQREQKLYTQFSINPFRKMHVVSGKLNSCADAVEEDEDPHFYEVINRANAAPVCKFTEPQTSSQEIGWMTQPLTDLDRKDARFYFPHNPSPITQFNYFVKPKTTSAKK